MKTLIVYASVHHGNTEKVGRAMADVLRADMVKTVDARPGMVQQYDLVGFGSGIYFGKHHRSLLDFVGALPPQSGRRAFVFSTSGRGSVGDHETLRRRLVLKNFRIVDEFACKGWDTYAFLRLIGGINRGRPNEKDLENARAFARRVKGTAGTAAGSR